MTDDYLHAGDIYSHAAAHGMLIEGQVNGLGVVMLPRRGDGGPGRGELRDCINRNVWGKALVLDARDPASAVVTMITVAGLPVNVGNQGTPLSAFTSNSTSFGISFGRRLALTGQTIVVTLENYDTAENMVTGGLLCDEMNPYAMQKWMEQMLLEAAVGGFKSGKEESFVEPEAVPPVPVSEPEDEQIGTVPLRVDKTGQVYVDHSDLPVSVKGVAVAAAVAAAGLGGFRTRANPVADADPGQNLLSEYIDPLDGTREVDADGRRRGRGLEPEKVVDLGYVQDPY